MNNEHYLNYAVYTTSHGDYLVKVTGGYFASDAWMKGDDAYADVVGRKFGGIFGDDGKKSYCDKMYIRRLASDEEFEKLYASSHLYFKVMILMLDMLVKVHLEHKKSLEDAGIPEEIKNPNGTTKFTDAGISMIREYEKICEFDMYAIAWFDRIGIDEIPNEEELRKMADAVLK